MSGIPDSHPWAHSRPKHVEISKYTKNNLCTKLALFTRLDRDGRSTEHKTFKLALQLQIRAAVNVGRRKIKGMPVVWAPVVKHSHQDI